VIHCTGLPDHKGILVIPELKRWEPVDVQPHKQSYLCAELSPKTVGKR
jgi:hypothetical protein